VNPAYVRTEVRLRIRLEADEIWSYGQKKGNPRWLWWVEDQATGEIVAFLFGRRTNASFRRLLKLLAESGIVVSRWFTDYWWASHDLLPAEIHPVGKDQTQSIERKHLELRTRIKRLARRTICFSKSGLMHDTVIGLLINNLFFKLDVHL
jgi:insertion element IS1 protein InsB